MNPRTMSLHRQCRIVPASCGLARSRLTVIATALLALAGVAAAQTLADVPGTVVYWRISPASVSGFALPPNRVYTTSPSIVVLQNGDYLLSFNLFGSDVVPPAETSGTTYLYRSSDDIAVEHEPLMQAIESGDAPLAASRFESHVERACDLVATYIDALPEHA